MPEQNAETKVRIHMAESLPKMLRTRCAELDTTMHGYVVDLFDRELSSGRQPPRTAGPEAGRQRDR